MEHLPVPRPPDNRPPGRPRRDLALDEPPTVIDGDVVRVIEIDPYPNALMGAAGCTNFRGHYVTDPVEIAAIALRTGGGGRRAMPNNRVRAVQGRRQSNAAGPHAPARRPEDDEPCVCGTGFTCLARLHDDEPDDREGA